MRQQRASSSMTQAPCCSWAGGCSALTEQSLLGKSSWLKQLLKLLVLLMVLHALARDGGSLERHPHSRGDTGERGGTGPCGTYTSDPGLSRPNGGVEKTKPPGCCVTGILQGRFPHPQGNFHFHLPQQFSRPPQVALAAQLALNSGRWDFYPPSEVKVLLQLKRATWCDGRNAMFEPSDERATSKLNPSSWQRAESKALQKINQESVLYS